MYNLYQESRTTKFITKIIRQLALRTIQRVRTSTYSFARGRT